MIRIRYLRVGKKKQPFFKIVVVQKEQAASSGRFIEDLGFYNPIKKEKSLKKERINYWLKQGAKPSDSIHNLFVKEGIVDSSKIAVHKKKKKEEEKKEEAVDKKS